MNFLEFHQKLPTEEKVIEYFIKIKNEEVVCPYCGNHKVYRRHDQQMLFTCKHYNTFSIFKETIFENTYTDLIKFLCS